MGRRTGNGWDRSRAIKWSAGGIVGLVVVACAAAQIVLPRIAEKRVREELRRAGVVSDVKVSAFPAVKLLLGEVDSLKATLGSSSTTDDEIGALLAKTRHIDRLHVSAPRIDVSGVHIERFRIDKHRNRVSATGSVAKADVASLAPTELRIDRVSVVDHHLRLTGSIDVLGATATGDVDVVARDGAIVARAPAGPLAGLGSVDVFAEKSIRVDRLDVRPEPDPNRVEATTVGRLR